MGAMMCRRRKLSFSLCISMCVHVRARGGVQTRVYTPEPILFSASVGPLRIYIIMQPTKSGCALGFKYIENDALLLNYYGRKYIDNYSNTACILGLFG